MATRDSGGGGGGGAGRLKVRNLIGHGFCCILFKLDLLLVSYRTATPC